MSSPSSTHETSPSCPLTPKPNPTENFSIGTVFDEEGNFWEEGLARYVEAAVQRFKRGQWDKPDEAKGAGAGGAGGKKGKEGKKNE